MLVSMAGLLDWTADALGGKIVRREHIQSLWGGYGELFRVELAGAPTRTAVVKWVKPPLGASDRSHQRKCRSYDVETAWYRDFASSCYQECRVAKLYASRQEQSETVLLLEDLDAAGYSARHRRPARDAIDRVLAWLAAFHARFMGIEPEGLWPAGSYWHLATRPEELALVADPRLRAAAPWLDQKLDEGRFRTLIHGDAKLANFCFAESGRGVAAVDFQYVGGGCGMKDVAYLLCGDAASEETEQRHLDFYFRELCDRAADAQLAFDSTAVEREWRELYPLACLDFHRFLAGWSASSWQRDDALRARADALLSRVGR